MSNQTFLLKSKWIAILNFILHLVFARTSVIGKPDKHNKQAPRTLNNHKQMRNILTTIQDYEDKKTIELFKQFKSIDKQNYLTKAQLIEILKWKSPRPLKHYLSNSENDVKKITALAFSTKDDEMKVHVLTALSGVNIPAASAILMFYNPKKFPVIDIRVWQQLHKAKLVDTNPKGQGFKLQEWRIYLNVIRGLAKDLKLTARQIEKRLFDLDKNTRKGKLYTTKIIK